MKEPSFADSLQVLLLQAADEGRGPVLFGESCKRVAREAGPFMIGNVFPSVYLECPLTGEPFMDITVLYSDIDRGSRVDHPAAEGANGMLEWFAGHCERHENVCCGFELDVKNPDLPAAAVHFQPRAETRLVRPFCESVGEPERADLYLYLAARMPEGWPLSFFGMFRGRPGSPLRVCGYLSEDEKEACGQDTARIKRVFDTVGFSAYDEEMLNEVCDFMRETPGTVDFQFDVYPDGSIGDTFAIDAQFAIEQPGAVKESFESGGAHGLMRMMEEKGIADERWKLVPEAAFASALPVNRADGSVGKYAFVLMPQWAKVRWGKGVLQPAKMYFLANASFVDER